MASDVVDPRRLIRNTAVSLGGTAVLLTLLIGASRLMGLVRTIVIAHQFGQDWQTDCYVAAFNIPEFFYFLLSGGALATGFVPVFTGYLVNDQDDRAVKTFRVLFTYLVMVLAIVIAIAWVFAPQLVAWAEPGFRNDVDKMELTVFLTRILLPAQLVFLVGGLFWGTLNSLRYFAVPAFQPILYNLFIIVGAVVGAHTKLGVSGMAFGALAGSIVAVVLIQAPFVATRGVSFKPSFSRRDKGFRQVLGLVLPVIFGLSVLQINAILLPRSFGSFLGEGGITAIECANRLMQLPVGLFGMSLAIALFPTLSERAAVNDHAELRRYIESVLRIVLLLTVPSAVILMVVRTPLISLLFEHGEFGADDTARTAVVLLFYTIGIPAMACQGIVARGFYALKDTWTPVKVGVCAVALALALNCMIYYCGWLEGRWLALSASAVAVANVFCLMILMNRRLVDFGIRRLIKLFVTAVLSSTVAGGAAWGLGVIIGRAGVVQSGAIKFLHVLAPIGIAISVYILLLWVMRVPELDQTLRRFRAWIDRRKKEKK